MDYETNLPMAHVPWSELACTELADCLIEGLKQSNGLDFMSKEQIATLKAFLSEND